MLFNLYERELELMMNVIIGMFCIVSKILLYFKNLLKKKLTFLLLGYYLQQEMGTNISL
jgi:hypothetical protein